MKFRIVKLDGQEIYRIQKKRWHDLFWKNCDVDGEIYEPERITHQGHAGATFNSAAAAQARINELKQPKPVKGRWRPV